MNKINLFRVRMSAEAKRLVGETLDSGYVGQGEKVEEFENKLWKKLGGGKPVTTNSCTSALDLALHLSGIGPGDVVISTPVTCFATNSVIINRGARIIWADVDPYTFCIDPVDTAKIIAHLPKGVVPKAIMAVDWAGRACNYQKLREIGDEYECPIIEDAAHCWNTFTKESYGNGTKEAPYGIKKHHISTHGGDYRCYSLQAIKFLTASDGGILHTNYRKDNDDARLLRWYGLDRTKGQSFRCAQDIKMVGYKYHMNDVCASIGLANLTDVDKAVSAHRRNAKLYDESFIDLRNVISPPSDSGCSYWLYSLLVEKGTKEEFIQHLAERGIEASPVHHRNDLYECTRQFKERELPGVNEFAKKQVSIPVGWYLSGLDIERIIDAVRSY